VNDRIKLAEAMGWIACEFTWQELKEYYAVPPNHPNRPGEGNITDIPDPFTDANDDYAVLEWMRKQGTPYRNIGQSYMYQIGDYARACLRVLNND